MYRTPNLAILQGRNHARPRVLNLGRLRGLGDLPAPISHPGGPYPVGQNPANLAAQQAVVDQNPLDYSSPQYAIAAGLDPVTVNAAWVKGLAKYKSQNEAVAAGIMPGVVTQLWAQSRSAQAPPSTNYGPLVMVGLAIAALMFLEVGDKGGAA